MSFEDLAVFFAVVHLFWVERNWSWAVSEVVVGPLTCSPIAERVVEEFFFAVVAGGAATMTSGGRAVPWKDMTYDCTKGFPGEDVLQ